MRVVLIGLALVATASATVEPIKGYFEEVGIPLAAQIKEAEESVYAKSGHDDKIVGGAIAAANAHPYLVGLIITLTDLRQAACGASLISANRLVTAAHCWRDSQLQGLQLTAVLGTQALFYGGVRVISNQVFMHPQWDPFTLNNDIAMIYLPTPVQFSNAIQPILLPTTADMTNLFVGNWVVAAGYGISSDQEAGVSAASVVRHVNLQVITVAQCAAVYTANFVRNTNICTNGFGGVGVCRGDSGGPLVLNRLGQPTLVGVSSFTAGTGCQAGHPSAFARVTSFLGFIYQHMW